MIHCLRNSGRYIVAEKIKKQTRLNPLFNWTTACKVLQCEDLWDEYNEKNDGYDYDKNLSVWDGCQPLEASVSILFKYSSYENVFKLYDLYRYQPIELNNIKPDEEINKKN